MDLVAPNPQVPRWGLGQQGQQGPLVGLQMPAYAQGQAANKEIVGHIAQLVGFQGMQTVWAHFHGHRQGF
jgi:hypothetical protein